jgi:hypothetical protein
MQGGEPYRRAFGLTERVYELAFTSCLDSGMGMQKRLPPSFADVEAAARRLARLATQNAGTIQPGWSPFRFLLNARGGVACPVSHRL